ncbi:MAG: DNA polymerase I [Patescibacteria group bacterium]
MSKREVFVIIDGNAVVHRAYHALPPLTTHGGMLINAAYGFTSVLLKTIKDLKPQYLAVTFDLPGKTFRHEVFPAYKAQRKPKPQEFYDQFDVVKQVVRAFRIPVMEKVGFEADDVIGTLVTQAEKELPQAEIMIVTGDMDTLQLVSDRTAVLSMKRGVSDLVQYDPAAVQARYGLRPDQVIDFKTLRGDPSDNIPGVKGIGEKTATELIQTFGSLDALLVAMDEHASKFAKLPAKLQERLTAGRKDIELSKKLVTILRDVLLDLHPADCRVQPYTEQEVVDLFQKFEFRSLLARLPEQKIQAALSFSSESPMAQKKQSHPNQAYTLIADATTFSSFLVKLKKQKKFALDTETSALDSIQAELLGMSMAWKSGEAYYIAVQLERTQPKKWKMLVRMLEDPRIKKVGHHAKYDLNVLNHHGIDLQGIDFDTMIASYLLHPGDRQNSLDACAFAEFGYRMMPITDLIGPNGKGQKNMRDIPLEDVAWYASEDADWTWRLYETYERQLRDHALLSLFQKMELPLIPVLAQMEQHGVVIDTVFLEGLSKKFHKKLRIIEQKIYKSAGEEFNILSPIQLREILFTKLKLSSEELVKTKTGISTAASELEKLRGMHPVVDLIGQYREFSKLISTYVDALPVLVNPKTGRVHTSYNQTIAATGRLSSSDPNLQNIPIRTLEGREIRKAFIAPRGTTLLMADYSQLELRIVASLAHDEKMIEIFKNREDIHARTAAEIRHISVDDVTPEMRRAAKAVNFGVIYGQGVYGLSAGADISHQEARAFIEAYFTLFSGVKTYLEDTKAFARKTGYVETFFGRRRPIPEIRSGVPQIRRAAERMAINMPVQGTEADIVKLAMIEIARVLPKISPRTKMLLQVHDELVFEVPNADVGKVSDVVKDIMEQVIHLEVPLEADLHTGKNWGEAHPLKA